MRAVGIILGLLTLLVGVRTVDAGRKEARKSLKALLSGVQVRRAVQHRSLAIVVLVAREDEHGASGAYATPGLGWEPAKGGRVALDATKVAEDRVLPTGFVLRASKSERLLAGPAFAAAGAETIVPAVRAPTSAPPSGERVRVFPGVVGPHARAVLATVPHEDAIRELAELTRRLVGWKGDDPSPSLLALRDAPSVRSAVEKTRRAIDMLPKAYGGTVQGHVLFLGNRPVEVVLAGTPKLYMAYARDALDGIGMTHALWEEVYGRAGLPSEGAPDWPGLLREATALVEALGKARAGATDDARGWRLRTKDAPRMGRLLLDVQDRAVLLEAWPLGESGPFPVPAREPGGRPVNERPRSRKSGHVTLAYLERYLERLKELRRKVAEHTHKHKK